MLWLMNLIISAVEWIDSKLEGYYRRKNLKLYKKIIKARGECVGKMFGLKCSAVRCRGCGNVFKKIHRSRDRWHLECPHCGVYDSEILRPLSDEEIKKYICK